MAGRHILRRLATVQSALRCSTVLASRGSQLVGMHVKSGAVSRIAASSLHTTRSCWNEHIINIQDEEDFNEKVIKSDKPVIVDFHATWCGPCKLLAPRLETLIASKAGKVIMAKVDIDDNSDLAIRHGVQAVPTVVSFKNGSKVDLFVGVKDDADLTSFINKLTGE